MSVGAAAANQLPAAGFVNPESVVSQQPGEQLHTVVRPGVDVDGASNVSMEVNGTQELFTADGSEATAAEQTAQSEARQSAFSRMIGRAALIGNGIRRGVRAAAQYAGGVGLAVLPVAHYAAEDPIAIKYFSEWQHNFAPGGVVTLHGMLVTLGFMGVLAAEGALVGALANMSPDFQEWNPTSRPGKAAKAVIDTALAPLVWTAERAQRRGEALAESDNKLTKRLGSALATAGSVNVLGTPGQVLLEKSALPRREDGQPARLSLRRVGTIATIFSATTTAGVFEIGALASEGMDRLHHMGVPAVSAIHTGLRDGFGALGELLSFGDPLGQAFLGTLALGLTTAGVYSTYRRRHEQTAEDTQAVSLNASSTA